MKISIEHFGPIDAFTFDLKDDFVLIVGANNIGKSYAISLVYLVLKTLAALDRPLFNLMNRIEGRARNDELSKWLKQFEDQFSAPEALQTTETDVTEHVRAHVKQLVEFTLLPPLQDSLYGTFSEINNLQSRYSESPMTIRLDTSELSMTLGLSDGKLTIQDLTFVDHRCFVVRRVSTNRNLRYTENKTTIYFPTENRDHFESNYRVCIALTLFHFVQDAAALVSDIHYLPASRSGLYQALSAFGQIVAELAKNRTMLSRKIELPGISEPLSDYFLKLSEVRPSRPDDADPYVKISQIIEQEVLKGNVEFDSKSKRLTFSQPDIHLSLDLSATSSMVSEISPIVSYLKYVLPRAATSPRRRGQEIEGRKQVIFVEEPEAHLHPQVQLALMRIFAQLVSTTKTKIVMTSHSNYIFNTVSNLIINQTIDPRTFRAVLFQNGPTGSRGADLKVSEFGIHDDNFVDVGEQIYEERATLIDSLTKN